MEGNVKFLDRKIQCSEDNTLPKLKIKIPKDFKN